MGARGGTSWRLIVATIGFVLTSCVSSDEPSPRPEPSPAAPGRIAFARRWGVLNPDALPGGIFTVDPDGSDLTRLTKNDLDLGPKWSPDGTRIAFGRRSWRRGEIYVVSASGGPARRVTHNLFPDRDAQWSPDGNHLVVLRDSVKPEAGIFVVSVRTGTETRLTDLAGVETAPEWSPDGARIVFGERYDGLISIVGLRSRRVVSVGEGLFDRAGPHWSPDGSLVAFIGDGRDLWLMSPDGTNERRLLSPGVDVGSFHWSPSGDRIAYIAQPESEDLALPEPFALHVVDVADRRDTVVVPSVSSESTPTGYGGPVWSPDGTQLAYSGWEDRDRHLWSLHRVAADGLTAPGVIPNTRAAVSPDWAR